MSGKVFISYKNTENGEITQDAVMAKELYDALTENGVECFFSTDSLRERGASDYRAVIDRELDECCVLIVVTTSADHVDSRWVEYEWSGFQNDLLDGRKDGKLFSYIDAISPRDLPRALRMVQSFRKSECSLEDIVMHIKNAVNEFCPEPEEQITMSTPEGSNSDNDKEKSGNAGETDPLKDVSVHEKAESGATEKNTELIADIQEEVSDRSQEMNNNGTVPFAGEGVSEDPLFQKTGLQEADAVERENDQTDTGKEEKVSQKPTPKKRGKFVFWACVLLAGLLLLFYGDSLSDGKAIKSDYKLTYSDKMLLGTFYSEDMAYQAASGTVQIEEMPRYYQNIVINGQEYELSLLPVIVAGDRREGGDPFLSLTFVDRFGEKYTLKGTYTVSPKGDIVFSVEEMGENKVSSSVPNTLEYYLVCHYDCLAIASGERYTRLMHDVAYRDYFRGYSVPLGVNYSLKGKFSEGSGAYKNIDSVDMVFGLSQRSCTVRFTDGSVSYSASAELNTGYEIYVKWSSVAKPYNGKTKVFNEAGKATFVVLNNEPYGFTILDLDYKTHKGEALYYMDKVE